MSVLRSRQVKKAFEGIFLQGGFAALQENTTLFLPAPGAGLTPGFFNTLISLRRTLYQLRRKGSVFVGTGFAVAHKNTPLFGPSRAEIP